PLAVRPRRAGVELAAHAASRGCRAHRVRPPPRRRGPARPWLVRASPRAPGGGDVGDSRPPATGPLWPRTLHAGSRDAHGRFLPDARGPFRARAPGDGRAVDRPLGTSGGGEPLLRY